MAANCRRSDRYCIASGGNAAGFFRTSKMPAGPQILIPLCPRTPLVGKRCCGVCHDVCAVARPARALVAVLSAEDHLQGYHLVGHAGLIGREGVAGDSF